MENHNLNLLIKNKQKKASKYVPFDPNLNLEPLIKYLDQEQENVYDKTWNKIDNGIKKKLIYDYYYSNNNIDFYNNVIYRLLYNGQLNKQYIIDYDISSKNIVNITKN